MDRTLFTFIWKHSKRDQFVLLAITLITFPFLFATLELPKRIINDAIGMGSAGAVVLGYEVTQIQFLFVLCIAFLLAVIANGLLKMRLNTMKGVVAERMLRRFRFQLLDRMMRFPKPYVRNTSQGELVAMVTSEAEPMGGLMGDALAQPVFQLGQMITILAFLFLQSFWFGLAAVSLIPLQAYLIPLIQRRINVMNIERVKQIRALSAEIGETAAGLSDLRTNGGLRFRRAQFTNRLGQLFDVRFRIYQLKFFMKFLNNFINQLTPFFFYLVGGYLAITGEITVGALVAALAAYKDLSSPWKELLTYYNQVADMSLRWKTVVERFAPKGMIDEALFEGTPETVPRLNGAISLNDVTVEDSDGNSILEDITLDIPAGARVALRIPSALERSTFADILVREVVPKRGKVVVSDQNLKDLHQSVITSRIGYAPQRPYLFGGTLGDNLMMPLRAKPFVAEDARRKNRFHQEALRSGNSADEIEQDWLDPSLAGLKDTTGIRSWWFELATAMGVNDQLFHRALLSQMDPAKHETLAQAIVDLRPKVFAKLQEEGLDSAVFRFDPYEFNPAVALAGNLLFVSPTRRISLEELAEQGHISSLLREQDIAEDAMNIAESTVDILHRTFGHDGTDHPLFRRLGFEPEMFDRMVGYMQRRKNPDAVPLTDMEEALLLAVPFALTAEQIGPSFPDSFKKKIVSIRRSHGAVMRERMGDMFVQMRPSVYLPRLTVIENAIYGRISLSAGAKEEQIENAVAQVLAENGLEKEATALVYDFNVGIGGTRLNTSFQERAAFSRAAIKRPDILILDSALASHDAQTRSNTREKLRDLLPDATLIFMESEFANPNAYDLFIEIKNGHIDGIAQNPQIENSDDLMRKMASIAGVELFSGLDRRSQRLLAFSATWYTAQAGQTIFERGERADAAYICASGLAELQYTTGPTTEPVVVSTIKPGRLIGDLSIIANQKRQLSLVTKEPTEFLRLGAEDLMSIVDSDVDVAANLLRSVSTNLIGAVDTISGLAQQIPAEKHERGIGNLNEANRAREGEE